MKVRPILLAAAVIGGAAVLLALTSSTGFSQTAAPAVTPQGTAAKDFAVSADPAMFSTETTENVSL